ncbi:REP-associated tyrosine transposase [Haloferula helveola]|uniref:REP-associated tyrosine transposase n=1 Tax=Haloferula helveola TaxID=490095 RepID=A0ABN6H840_9BACT|nr:REP-associated tyrosine transposase [Haloferula helveola]
MEDPRPQRKQLPHAPPEWLEIEGQVFFLTLCCKPRGKNQLANAEAWQSILETFHHYDRLGHWHTHRVLAMPDHLHSMVSLPAEAFLKKRVASFKAWTAKHAGVVWQRDFFDHRLRRDESFEAKSLYIAMNPVRAGLCATPGEWPYFWKKQG